MTGVDPSQPDHYSDLQPGALSRAQSWVRHKLQLVLDWCKNPVEVTHCKSWSSDV